jgi:hypothetical protein
MQVDDEAVGRALVARGLLDPGVLARALAARAAGQRLGDLLLAGGLVSGADLAATVADLARSRADEGTTQVDVQDGPAPTASGSSGTTRWDVPPPSELGVVAPPGGDPERTRWEDLEAVDLDAATQADIERTHVAPPAREDMARTRWETTRRPPRPLLGPGDGVTRRLDGPAPGPGEGAGEAPPAPPG